MKTGSHNPNYRHGFESLPEYRVWAGMKQRCYDKNADNYRRYGGRGIQVCEAWLNPKEFIDWLHANGWQKGLTIERTNNNDNYHPGNCILIKHQYNCWNKGVKNSNNTSGYGGVTLTKYGTWQATTRMNGKRKYLGVHRTAKIAALYKDAYILARGALLPMNFPEVAICR